MNRKGERTMKLIGYKESNFRPDKTKDEEIKGYMIYIEMEIDPHRGKEIKVFYNRYGKIASIRLADE